MLAHPNRELGLPPEPRLPADPALSQWGDSSLAADIHGVLSGAGEVTSLLTAAIDREPDPVRAARAVLARTACADLCRRLKEAAAAQSPETLGALLIEMDNLCTEVSELELLVEDH
ncbi:hypothetical protein FB468_2328 [Leucobacter komagatae]|uniref:Uncharacterized protein n=1 Tax=Leucobacter komagatae TaxID=55969 RepID=A0A542Y8C0_9MICO|nr:hypothetical protein [Leucobacter komagatae]TQL44277.1 hypothetical protein FB468_2328 [Leucobacter komagatae]